MRSVFLSRLSRLCIRMKPPALEVVSYTCLLSLQMLCISSSDVGLITLQRHLGGARFLSEVTLGHIAGAERCGSNSRDGDVGNLVIRILSDTACGIIEKVPREFFDRGRKVVLEKKVPMDLMKATGTIGASHGWVATLKDGIVCLQDDLNPKRFSLPPLETLPHCQTQLVTNVAMSSSCPEDDDCIVAVKFLGPQLSLFRRPLSEYSQWVNIRIEDPSFVSSQVMYSKRDKMLSMLASGGTHTASWDIEKRHITRKFRFPYYPEFVRSKWERLLSCHRSQHLVESPRGETFLVKWYRECFVKTGMFITEHFSVFRIMENHETAYLTKDIGDLCIFLSHKGEPFCLEASLYGRLSPNFIYYLGTNDHGKFNLGRDENVRGYTVYPVPYFIPLPQS